MKNSSQRTEEEFRRLYEQYVDMVYRLCFTFMKNKADTEDAVQNTFIKLLRHEKSFENSEHEKAWLLVTASNTCKDALRKTGKAEESLEQYEECLLSPEQNPDRADVLEAVMSLPVKYRSVIYLYYYEGYTGGEIAQMMERPASTIRNYLHEARQKLKSKLGGDFDEE